MRESITVNSSSNNGAGRPAPDMTMHGFGGVKVKLCEIERPVTIDPLFQLFRCQPLICDLFESHREGTKSAWAMVSPQPSRGRQTFASPPVPALIRVKRIAQVKTGD